MKIIKPGDGKQNLSDKRLTDKLIMFLNSLIQKELFASQVYQAMAEWCEDAGYTGSSNWFRTHADEERNHMKKVYEYLQDRDELPVVPSVAQPEKLQFTSLLEVFKEAYTHEKKVTAGYNELSELCLSEKDFMTFSFALSFLDEQREEEAKVKTYIDELSIVDGDKAGLFAFDKYIN